MNNATLVHEYSVEEVVTLSIISIAIIIAALPLNILVLLGYLCSRSTREKPPSILLVSMTFGQLITACLVIPFQLVFQVIKPSSVVNGGALCTFIGSITYAPHVVISETIVCMAVDRYFAVCHMLKYKTVVTRKRVFAAVGFIWVHSLIDGIVIVPLGFKVKYHQPIGTCAIVWDNRLLIGCLKALAYAGIPFVIIVVLSWKTLVHLRKHNRRIITDCPRLQRLRDEREAQERKLAFMVFYVIGTCLLCWLPVIIVGVLQSFPEAYPSPLVNATAYLFLHLSDVCNPIFNLYFRRDIRNTIKKLCSGRHQHAF